ncbi:MAG: hypothetical protein IJN62_00740 [Clostridia bacterium]|nr:hypothetical protein [Clostridia bacterium]
MIFTEEKTSNLKFPNITIGKRLRNGQPCAYIASADDGYVIYDTAAENYIQQSPDTEPEKVIYYHSRIICPLNFDFSKFTWAAVPLAEANPKHIF